MRCKCALLNISKTSYFLGFYANEWVAKYTDSVV